DYNAMPKYVVSNTVTDVSAWNNTSVLSSLDEVAELRNGDGDAIIVHGSATLAQGLAAAGLVDRYHLLVFPILLGSGKRLFAGFTMDAVAERAQTSRPVLYRRWPDRQSLAIAAITHVILRDRIEIPETGSLREDIITVMELSNESRAALIPVIGVQLGSY
ncbi:dihydrofolate reductase family protein, partial [Rhizobium johnstonii]|uniref:dihydrofolate reductase family protein n=1 Tax=Rhizobium johnstonii TaxID=3019933 RepID=UPI003F9D8E07